MNNKREFIILVSLLIVLLVFNLLLPSPLNDFDGRTHFESAMSNECYGMVPNTQLYYPNAICVLNHSLAEFGQFWFWLEWFIIIGLVYPLIFFILTKNKDAILGYFMYTGLFFTMETLQIYSQALLGLVLLYSMLCGKPKHVIALNTILLVFYFLGVFRIHRLEPFVCGALIAIEIFMLIKNKYIALSIFGFVDDIRNATISKMLPDTPIYIAAIYYGYQFLIKNMPFWYSIPALWQVIKDRNIKVLLYFLLIVGAGIFMWFQDGTMPWSICRLAIWIPLVLLPSFLVWKSKQSTRIQNWIVNTGLLWLLLQLGWYMLNKSGMY